MQTFLDPSPLRGKHFTVYACAGLRSEAERGAIGHESPFAFAASTSTGSPTTEAGQKRDEGLKWRLFAILGSRFLAGPRFFASDKVCEALFHLPEATDAEPNKERGDNGARHQAGQVKIALPAQDAPAKAIDHSYHRIEGIHQTPRLGNDA